MSVLTPSTLLIPRPLNAERVEVRYKLADEETLLDLAREVGAVVGYHWDSLRPYAYITQQRIGGEWFAFVEWGQYDAVGYSASARFAAPPLDGLTDGQPLPGRAAA
jgi:hypothetical protein